MPVNIKYPNIGVCGLSCRLCPRYYTEGPSRCAGCKTESRMSAGCPFITCALKKHSLEFCWDCPENESCEKWAKHREAGKNYDSFKCYQKLEADILFIQKNSVAKFDQIQQRREKLLVELLNSFNEGRSKNYYCIAATVLEISELEDVVSESLRSSGDLDVTEKSKIAHRLIDMIAKDQNYCLKLRSV
jgi:hypothetical protein